MNYILILLFLVVNQSDATDDSSQKRSIRDSFDVNIGAGYAVGADQSQNNDLPNGTSSVSLSKHLYSNSLKTERTPDQNIRKPRLLTNFTPQTRNPVPEQPKNPKDLQKSVGSHYKEHYSAAPSNIHSYSSPSFQTSLSNHFDHPNLLDFKNVLEKVGVKKPYSKVVQVIKVPAIYEIHLQTDDNNISQNKINLGPTADSFFKNYYENKPNITTQYSDEYSNWLKDNNMQREEHFSKDGEKSYDFSDTPIVTYEHYPSPHTYTENLKENPILDPIISHHYNRHTRNDLDKDEVIVNYNTESSNKLPWQNLDYPYSKKQQFADNNFKKDIGYSNSYPSRIPVQASKPLLGDDFNFLSTSIKSSPVFKHHQAIANDDKPQALHEVPAPVLGKYSNTKPFELQKASQTNSYPKVLPSPTLHEHTKTKVQKVTPSNINPVNHKLPDFKVYDIPAKKQKIAESEVAPSGDHFASFIKGNQNLIYGKSSGKVLTPYEINIPVTPGSTTRTVTENIAPNSHRIHQYSAKIKSGIVSEESKGLDHYFKNKSLQNSKKTVPSFQYATAFTAGEPQIRESSNHYKVVEDTSKIERNSIANLQYPVSKVNNIDSFSSEKPIVLENKIQNYYQQMVDIPYQTQKSITSEHIVFTTPRNLETSTTKFQEHTVNHHPDHINIKNNTQKNGILSGETKPIFTGPKNSRRRTFDMLHNMMRDTFTNNAFKNKELEYSKPAFRENNDPYVEYSRPPMRENNSPHMDYVIYITRKATD